VSIVSALDSLIKSVDGFRGEMTTFMVELLKIRAVNPDGGGRGEYERALFLKRKLESFGIKVSRYDVPDPRVAEGVRVSLASVKMIAERCGLWHTWIPFLRGRESYGIRIRSNL